LDWTNIIVAGLALVGTAFGSIMGVLTSNKMTVYRIDQLEKKVDKHNEVIKRTYVLEEQMKVANHRIEDLEIEERR
jgi:ABC-type phosphate transport system auxiliary subunit